MDSENVGTVWQLDYSGTIQQLSSTVGAISDIGVPQDIVLQQGDTASEVEAVYVLDSGLNQVCILSADGKFIQSFNVIPGGEWLEVTPDGEEIYVMGYNVIQVYERSEL